MHLHKILIELILILSIYVQNPCREEKKINTWTSKQDLCNKIRAFKIWCYSLMLQVTWIDKVINIVLHMKILERKFGKEKPDLLNIHHSPRNEA